MARIRFDAFDLDLDTGELCRDGVPVALKAQGALFLTVLARSAGRLVPRQALIEGLWPDSIVAYDQGLNSVVKQVRAALRDDPRAPRYIETVPRQGYRFIAPVEPLAGENAPATESVSSHPPAASPEPRPRAARLATLLAVVACLLAVISLWRVSRPRPSEPPTLAVLPFSSSPPETDVLGASLSAELTRELSVARAGPLRVVGQISAARASRHEAPVEQVGRGLGATHVVTGSVSGAGSGLEVDVALVRVEDGALLWSERQTRSWSELLLAPRELARDIAQRVTEQVAGEPPLDLAPLVIDPRQVEAYLRGRYLLADGSAAAAGRAVPLLRTVVEAEPRFAAARVALGEALLAAPDCAPAKALEEAVEALRLDPLDPRAHLLRGRLAMLHEWDWQTAGAHLARAVELAPGDPLVYAAQAGYLASLGLHTRALEFAATARRLDPLSATVWGDLAAIYWWAGDNEALLRETEGLLELEPEHSFARSLRLEALLALGRWEEARAEAVRISGEDADLLAAQGAAIGQRFAEIQEHRWRLEPASALRSMVLASLAAEQDHRAEALRQLEEAVRLRSTWLPFLPVDPHFSGFEAEAGYQALLRRAGHPLADGSPVASRVVEAAGGWATP